MNSLCCRRCWLGLLLACGVLGLPLIAMGLASHEILLLVNQNSPRSMEVANHFARIRRVPPSNIVYLDVPDRVLEPAAQLSPGDFERTIWTPAQEVLAERELTDQILAWVYSVDFPVRITTDPPVSITGLTFHRNQLPAERDAIYRGQYLSPIYAGPDPEGRIAPGASLIRYREALQERVPLPAMMLGFCGSRGNSVDTVLRTIRYGEAADRSTPRGTIYWISGSDIRAEMRNWQFPYALLEVQAANVRADVSEDAPVNLPGIIGLQMGQATVRADRAGTHFPGSMAEHATSHAAEFHVPVQTKMTDWIRAGATASAGTVTEPYAIWTKFPHARFFGHYVRGHSMLESFYMSLRSPAQTLLLGEPLTRPWAPPLSMTLIALDEDPVSGQMTFAISLFPEVPEGQIEYRAVLNGKPIPGASPMNHFAFDTRDLPDGYNEVRAISYVRTPIVHTTMDTRGFRVDNHGRQITLLAPQPDREYSGGQPLKLEWATTGEPDTVQVVHHSRVLAEVPAAAGELEIDPTRLGAGPVRLQVRALYEDGMKVASSPVSITIQRHSPLPAAADEWQAWEGSGIPVSGGELTRRNEGAYVFSPETEERPVSWAMQPQSISGVTRWAARLAIPGDAHAHPTDEIAGLIFDRQEDGSFRFFALHGAPSAWSFGDYTEGRLRHRVQRGAPLLRGTPRDIELVFSDQEVQAFVEGQFVARWALPHPPSGHLGLLAGGRPAAFHSVRYQVNNEKESKP